MHQGMSTGFVFHKLAQDFFVVALIHFGARLQGFGHGGCCESLQFTYCQSANENIRKKARDTTKLTAEWQSRKRVKQVNSTEGSAYDSLKSQKVIANTYCTIKGTRVQQRMYIQNTAAIDSKLAKITRATKLFD